MRIALLEPFFTGSHKSWANEYERFSKHEVKLFSLSGHHWKWRMHGGAITLADKFLNSNLLPDLILASDMLDLTTFLSLTRQKTHSIPAVIYFHENQLSYPWSPTDKDIHHKRDNHYGFINYASALAASKVFFNSQYHLNSFFAELPNFLKGFPDNQGLTTVASLKAKSSVLPLGMDLKRLDALKPKEIPNYERAVLLWNHRWEYDKNPEQFFQALFELQERGIEFKLIVLGEKFSKYPKIFDEAKERLHDAILHWGYAEDEREYVKWLCRADILPVTSFQDFFGVSVIQAMYCDVFPLLPKRLAYPEHIPHKLHPVFFYEDNHREFVNRLQRLIFDVRMLRSENIRQFAGKYDWGEMSTVYDEQMQLLVHG